MTIIWILLGSTLGFFISSAPGASKTDDLYAQLRVLKRENEILKDELSQYDYDCDDELF